jgi:separase
LEDLHPRLCHLYNSPLSTSTSRFRFHLMSIALPSSEEKYQDPALLALTSTYLSYALGILSTTCFAVRGSTKDASSSIDTFYVTLITESTLLTWAPLLSSLPGKHMDSTLMRAYTALTRSCANCTTNPKAVFMTRLYAMGCLAHTTTGTIEPSNFWNQITRFGGAFIKTQINSQGEAMDHVLSAYADLVNRVERRTDREMFMSGKSFVRFSEYWMAFAKKVFFCTSKRD